MTFDSKQLRDACNKNTSMIAKFGVQNANVVKRALDDLVACENLHIVSRIAEIVVNEQDSIKLTADFGEGVVFECTVPATKDDKNNIDWQKIKKIKIIQIITGK